MQTWKYYFLIVALSLLPLLYLFLSPSMPHTSDGLAHTIRFAAFYKEFSSGQLPVRWVQQFHHGYGTALFNFVAPLAYIIATPLVALHFPLTLVLKMSFLISYIVGGLCMFLFGQKLFGSKQHGLLVAILYQFAPFRLVEMNVRGNLGSLYAYALAPLLFYALMRLQEKKCYSSFVLTALSVALLALSHTILGYVFILLGIIFYITTLFDRNKIMQIGSAYFVGFGLAAFFIIPAIFEQKYTNGYLFSKDIFYDHFPTLYKLFIPNIFNTKELLMSEISVQIGLFHVLSLFLLVYLLITKQVSKKYIGLSFFIVITTLCTLLFMLPITKPLWEHIPLIRQFQFPWRFLAVIVFTSTLSAGICLVSINRHLSRVLFVTIIFLIVGSTAYYWRPIQGYDQPNETLYWNYPLTTNYFSEVNTIWMGEEPTHAPIKQIEVVSENAKIANKRFTSTYHSVLVTTTRSSLLVDNTYYFPGWKVKVDGKYADVQFQDPNYRGLITLEIPPGTHQVDIQFEQSKIQQLSNFITLGTVVFLIVYAVIQQRDTVSKQKKHLDSPLRSDSAYDILSSSNAVVVQR